jgi:hypothetical protein
MGAVRGQKPQESKPEVTDLDNSPNNRRVHYNYYFATGGKSTSPRLFNDYVS